MNKITLEKIEKLFMYFIMYSVIGWTYEVFLETVIYKWGFSNRGVLFGPYCPVYGFGVLIFLFTVYPIIKDKPIKKRLLYIPIVFIGCMVIATLLELLTSYLCELTMGSWPWQTYARDYKIHFQGRIALSPSIRFGLGGTVFLYILQPVFEKLMQKLRSKEDKHYINIISYSNANRCALYIYIKKINISNQNLYILLKKEILFTIAYISFNWINFQKNIFLF